MLVVGGGTSGATCANAAGREGARTVLLELCPGLGGTGTVGSVYNYDSGSVAPGLGTLTANGDYLEFSPFCNVVIPISSTNAYGRFAIGGAAYPLATLTIVTNGSDEVIVQITKHLNRLIEVVKVVDLTEGSFTARELMLVKVRAVGKERDEMMRMADIFRGRIIDVTEKSYTIELTGDLSKNDAFLEAIDRSAVLETVRTGACGIGRGERILRV